jgi:intraflagellar transport protein 22
MSSLKVVVAGPKGTGKTVVSNFLAGQSDSLDVEKYDETAGARILELEQQMSYGNVKIELWDSSGDHQYESCWRGIMSEADGVVLIYNPDAPGQDQQIHDWFDFFVRKNGLSDQQCMIFAHRPKNSAGDRFKPPPLFSRVTAALTTTASGGDMKAMFQNFTKEIYNIKRRS